MKERFKELAEQAGLYDFVFEAMGIDEEMQKFAELIVQECIDIVPWMYEAKIKEHFGSEEA